jgi:hypothetical protein
MDDLIWNRQVIDRRKLAGAGVNNPLALNPQFAANRGRQVDQITHDSRNPSVYVAAMGRRAIEVNVLHTVRGHATGSL